MDKKYEILEYHKVINNLIDKSNLESTKERFLDLAIYKSKNELDKELSLLRDFIDFYKFDGGLELINISNISTMIANISIFGNYLEKKIYLNYIKIYYVIEYVNQDLKMLKKNIKIYGTYFKIVRFERN